MPCSEISAAWAAQRIKNLDLMTALRNALLGSAGARGQVVTSLIERFHYPRLGPGMMWERCRDLAAARGVRPISARGSSGCCHDGGRVHAVDVVGPTATTRREPCDALISTMPVGDLVRAIDPAPPAEVLEAAGKLRLPGLSHRRPDRGARRSCSRTTGSTSTRRRCTSAASRTSRTGARTWSTTRPCPSSGSSTSPTGATRCGSCSDEALIDLGTSEARTIGLFAPERGPGRHRRPHAQGVPGVRRRVRAAPRRRCAAGSSGSTISSRSDATACIATTTRITRCSPRSTPCATSPAPAGTCGR